MELAIYDLSGIQSFIFATNKLKEIIGGSKIVSKALFENIPVMLGQEEHNAWKKEPFSFGNEDEAKIVYIGGGNALMVFSDENEFKVFTYKLSEKVFFQSGGSIRLCSASIKLDEEKTFSENQKRLMEKLNNEKKMMGTLQPSVCAPFVAYDNNNYEALVYYEDKKQAECLTRSRKSKITAYADPEKALKNGKGFASQFEDFAKDDEKNYLAIIHIDGNTMGIKIREYVESLNNIPVLSAFDKLKEMSVEISEHYRDVLDKTVSELFNEYKDEKIPFRPIIADGDDITVMISSHYAFSFVEKFFEKLKSKTMFNGSFIPTAAAGVVFCKIKFPFATAYDLAEECCKNAKSETRKRMGTEKSYNSIDYQMIYSGVNESLEQTRKELYEIADSEGTAHLIRRPYIFDDASDYSYKKFDEVAKEIIKMLKEKSVARTKLKGLRNAYGNGKTEAENYFNYIKSHAKTKKEEATVNNIEKNLFTDNNEAILFDVLDIMDIAWEEAEKDE